MASVHKHIRSGTASKRPTTAIAEGQIALATNIASPGLFFKDSTGATIVKIGPVHVGATAPNATPAGSAGNSIGEVWLDTSLTPIGVKIYDGTAFVNATPIGSTTVQGLLELATDAETQTGSDAARAVTPASLQSKLSDSTSTTSASTIASSTAVKAAFDLAGLALPKTGGTVTGNLEIGTAGSLTFEGATADGFETTIAVVDPTADRTITLPNTTGTIVTTGDTGTVTSTMLLDGTIVDADINAAAAIAYSKLATLTSANIVLGSSANVATSTAVTGDVTIGSTGVTAIAAGVIVNADVNASAAIAGTKIAPDFGAQNIATTGSSTAATFNPTGTTAPVTGVYSPGANRLGITTNSVERVEFGASEVVFNDDAADYDFRIEGDTNSNLFFADASAEAVGIRTATPVSELNVSVGNGGNITISNTNDAHSAGLAFGDTTSNSSGRISYDHSTNALAVATNGTQRITIDSSGRLLAGTSTSRALAGITANLQIEGTNYNNSSINLTNNSNDNQPAYLTFGKSRTGSVGGNTVVQNNDNLGIIQFAGADGTDAASWAASIKAEVDGTPGADDMPGRLVFSTTADGASSPTERMRIKSNGVVLVGKTAEDSTSAGCVLENTGTGIFVRNGSDPLILNRLGDDGDLVALRQASVTEGTISVSGTTVSYNGAHLSRWSQLPSGTIRIEILRGTVLSNLDEMCEWIDAPKEAVLWQEGEELPEGVSVGDIKEPTNPGGPQDNEQLNRMKVSEVEGDKNVSGVFQCWDDGDDTYINDFYCAMTGDFIIRIAEGVTVERGDLLMSAGDGTAKPQDDDIIRSKTVAKVTSTNVTCTYEDGSYCVPCVLMAC